MYIDKAGLIEAPAAIKAHFGRVLLAFLPFNGILSSLINMKIIGIILFVTLIVGVSCRNPVIEDIQPTTEELNIISETNRVRTNPRGYALELSRELGANRATWHQSTIDQYEVAIARLNTTEARHPLSFDHGLFLAARDHAEDMIENDFFSHTGSDGSSVSDRIQRQGSYSGLRGENIAAYSRWDTGASMVLAWVLSPGHLSNILSRNYTLIGPAHVFGDRWIGVQKFAERKN